MKIWNQALHYFLLVAFFGYASVVVCTCPNHQSHVVAMQQHECCHSLSDHGGLQFTTPGCHDCCLQKNLSLLKVQGTPSGTDTSTVGILISAYLPFAPSGRYYSKGSLLLYEHSPPQSLPIFLTTHALLI